MKYFIAILLLFATAGYISCKKKGSTAPVVGVSTNQDSDVFMKATINGVTWNTDTAVGYSIATSTNDSGKVDYRVSANKTVNGIPTTITLYITSYTGLGMYNINPPLVSVTYYQGSIRHFASSGQITMVSDTAHSLIGNFNFIADSITATNGSFNAAY